MGFGCLGTFRQKEDQTGNQELAWQCGKLLVDALNQWRRDREGGVLLCAGRDFALEIRPEMAVWFWVLGLRGKSGHSPLAFMGLFPLSEGLSVDR